MVYVINPTKSMLYHQVSKQYGHHVHTYEHYYLWIYILNQNFLLTLVKHQFLFLKLYSVFSFGRSFTLNIKYKTRSSNFSNPGFRYSKICSQVVINFLLCFKLLKSYFRIHVEITAKLNQFL